MSSLPIGAVVDYAHEHKRARLIVVGIAPGNVRDPYPLYFLAERPIAWLDAKLYSKEFLAFNLEAGWTAGNVDHHLLTDTGERVKVEPFKMPALTF